MLFNQDTWERWVAEESRNYAITFDKAGRKSEKFLKKGYLHFDPPIWFPRGQKNIKSIIENGLRTYHIVHRRLEYYAFSPFIKLLIKTPRYRYQEKEGTFGLETKIRPICYAAHRDSLLFGYYAFALNEIYQHYIKAQGFDEAVLAYRTDLKGKSNIQFAGEVFEEVRRRGNCTAIALDIKGYFDHIDHRILKEKWERVIGAPLPKDQKLIYRCLTTYSYVNKNSILKKYDIQLRKLPKAPKTLIDLVPGVKTYEKYMRLRADKLIVTNDLPNKKTGTLIGIPQGTPMSALLSNIYLCDYDAYMQKRAQCEGFLYRRYCDDILIVCDSDKANALQADAIDKITRDCRLIIQDKKVEMTRFSTNAAGQIRAFNQKKMDKEKISVLNAGNEQRYYKSLQYLGFEYNGQDIFIRSSSLSRYFRRLKGRVVKTISMAYSDKGAGDKIFKEKLLHRYTHLGKRNFLSYAYKAAGACYVNAEGEVKKGLNSPAIKKQVRRHFVIMMNNLAKVNEQRFNFKGPKAKKMKTI